MTEKIEPLSDEELTGVSDLWLASWADLGPDNLGARLLATITALKSENEKLTAALEPFAECAQCDKANDPCFHDDLILVTLPGDVIGLRGGYEITVGDLRRARAALAKG